MTLLIKTLAVVAAGTVLADKRRRPEREGDQRSLHRTSRSIMRLHPS